MKIIEQGGNEKYCCYGVSGPTNIEMGTISGFVHPGPKKFRVYLGLTGTIPTIKEVIEFRRKRFGKVIEK